ncbi:MAG: helix-turn-helix domain-containing protein [Bacteroidales bacterium]|nr:helix-turn-helix domain-containing protein [Bacteroidales bacterium]MCF8337182.1 helix-turn-helix domain-containing protein [Bacteroidales bacterium]
MSSNINIQKICQHCGAEFTAQTTKTRYCSHKCANRAYKARKRNKKVETAKNETRQIKNRPLEELTAKDFLSITDTYRLLGVSRRTVYRMINRGDLNATKIGGRTIITRSDIELLFMESKPKKPKKTDYKYTISINEAIEKYNISEKAFYELRKRHKIPKIKKGKFSFVPESLLEKYLK